MVMGMVGKPISLARTPLGDEVLTKKGYETKPRFDKVLLGPGPIPNPIRFFVAPQGQAGSGWAIKGPAITNNFQSNQLDKGVAVNIAAVQVMLYAFGDSRLGDNVMRRIAALWEDARIFLKVASTVELTAQLKEFASGSGMSGIANMNSPAPRTWLAPGPSIRGVRRLRRMILVAARQRFVFEIYWNQNNTYLAQDIPAGEEIVIASQLYGMTSRNLD